MGGSQSLSAGRSPTEPPRALDSAIDDALALWQQDQPQAAVQALQCLVQATPGAHVAWLWLGHLLDRLGQPQEALTAHFQAVTRAQGAGQWTSEATTPAGLLPLVGQAIQRVRLGRRELFLGAMDGLRQEFGAQALARMEHAIRVYLKEVEQLPEHPMQRPKFFYFPGLPDLPFDDSMLHPWARQLADAFPEIRAEALEMLQQASGDFRPFVELQPNDRMDNYVAGDSPDAAWDAYFFYRRGRRFDEHHARCPRTSAALESIDLCRIPGQAPEILFSALRPGSTILPHRGVTNTRLVMHLPLVVPDSCALHLEGFAPHVWREGELVMFDDTYLHEAWNHSSSTRVILLMDCWNPHLTEVERLAITRFIERVGQLKYGQRG